MKKICFLFISIFLLIFSYIFLKPVFAEPQFNIYNTPQEYSSQEVDRYENELQKPPAKQSSASAFSTPASRENELQKPPAKQSSASAFSTPASRENVLIILDCSYSMDDEVRGKRKIDIARDVINDVLGQLPKNMNIGFRVYGHTDGGFLGLDGCKSTELLVPIGCKTQNAISAQLKNLDAVGWTPICYSLDQAINNDFTGINGLKRIILVSDGMDTCGGSPCDFAVNLMKRRTDVTIDVIGFDISSEPSAISQLKCVALATHGKFYTANNAAEFTKSLKNSLNVKKEVEGKIFSK